MRSPLRESWAKLGAHYGAAELDAAPNHFGDPSSEYAAARESAAVVDRSSLSKIELRGRDRAKFLHNLCTNDIKALAAGQGCEAFFTTVQGKVLAHVRVFAGPDAIRIDTIPGVSAALVAHLERYLIMEQVELADRTNQFAQMLLVGPHAREIVTSASDTSLPHLRHLDHVEVAITSDACRVLKNEALVVPAFEIETPVEHAEGVWQRLWEIGQPLGMKPMGDRAYETLRVEAGLPLYGVDIDDSNLPQEVGRDELTISFTKGCYLGQETVARIHALGHVNRHLVGLALPGCVEPPDRRSAILSGSKTVGNVTSAVFSHSLDCAIALGYVRRGLEKARTELAIESHGTTRRALVQPLPFPRASDFLSTSGS